jgi:hypothetical protein
MKKSVAMFACGRAIALSGSTPYTQGDTFGGRCILVGFYITKLEMVVRKHFENAGKREPQAERAF